MFAAASKGRTGAANGKAAKAVTSIAKIKKQQKAYHATMRDELTGLRADIFSRQKARFEELATPALEKLGKDRLEAYDEFKARHRAEKGELHRDQAAGDRRRDVLGGLTPANQNQGSALTPEQAAAYIAQARETAKQHGQFNRAGDQVTTPDLRRAEDPPARDPREQTRDRTEQTTSKVAAASREANKEKTAKEIERMRRAAAVDQMLAERKADRSRGGGRSRDR